MDKIRFFTTKYEFEIEVIVRCAWAGIRVIPAPINVYYPPEEERITHFRKVPDFSRVSVLNTVLVVFALLYYKPRAIFRSLKKKSIRQQVREHLLESDEPVSKTATAVAIGVFFSCSPFWGFQTGLAILSSVIFKLNKVITVLATTISLPPFIPLIIYAELWLGSLILGEDLKIIFSWNVSQEDVEGSLRQFIVGSIAFSAIFGAAMGLITSVSLGYFRKQYQLKKTAWPVFSSRHIIFSDHVGRYSFS